MRPHLPILTLCLLLLAIPTLAADVEYSTTGAMDTPATMGGDRDGWGTDFITRWDNTTGQDVLIEEFGWPCGGWWAQFWYVWITDTLPANPWTLDYHETFVAASEDDTEWPPSVYTYIDVSEEGMVVPAGGSMYFGYGNPGMGGQIGNNGVATWSWFDDSWDMDGDFNRTAVMQFKGSYQPASAVGEMPESAVSLGNHPNPFNPTTTISFTLERDAEVTLEVFSLRGQRVRRLAQGPRAAGVHHVQWDGKDDDGRPVPSGAYMARMSTAEGSETRKMVLAK